MGQWFSKSTQTARVIANNANTNVLVSALRNYVSAVNSLKPNMRTSQAITNLLNQANVKANNKRVIRNRLANGIAKIVAASRRALPQAAAAVANGAPEGPAAAAVNNATAKIKNLNAFMNTLKSGNAAAQVSAYITGGRNETNNRALNAGRGAKYTSLFNAVNIARLNKKISNLGSQLPNGSQITNANRAMMYMSKYSSNYIRNKAINKNGKYAGLWAAIAAANAQELPGANIELTRNAFLPNTNNRRAQLVRNSGNSNWRFVNAANAAKYNINRKNKNDPLIVLKGRGAAVNKSKAAAQLLFNQAYGGRFGVGIASGAWTVNKSVQNLVNTNNKMARFIGINRAVVNANLNARSNQNQARRAKNVLNAIIQKQKAVPGN